MFGNVYKIKIQVPVIRLSNTFNADHSFAKIRNRYKMIYIVVNVSYSLYYVFGFIYAQLLRQVERV